MRQSSGFLVVVFLVGMSLQGCAPKSAVEETPSTEADVEAVKRVREQAVAAINAGDMDTLISLWSDDIVRMWPNEPAVVGKEANRSRITHRSSWKVEFTMSHEEVFVSGDRAFHRGTYRGRRIPKAGGEPMEIDMKCIDILRRQLDGSWKHTHVMCNPNKPGSLFE